MNNEWVWIAILFVVWFFGLKILKSLERIRESQSESRKILTRQNIKLWAVGGVITGLAGYGAVELLRFLYGFRWW